MPRKAIYGFHRGQFNIYVPLPAGTGLVESVTDMVPGFDFVVEKVTAHVAIAGTGAGATRVLNILKGASTVVATATVTLADTATVGVLKAFTTTAANAKFLDADTLSVEWPTAGAVAFTAGAIVLTVHYRSLPQREA